MDRLWAPWRINYIRSKKERGCIICRSLKSRSKSYIIFQSRYSFAILNIYPYNNGHILVSPKRHLKELDGLNDTEILDLFHSLNRAKKLIAQLLKPQGYNIGINISESSGAGITGHLHVHIVPRWKGDTNFMPVLSNTKVISQSLDELYARLRRHVKSGTD